MVNVLKKHLISYFIVLVDFLFVVSFVINIKKMTNVRQTFQISLTDINCARAQSVRFELSGSNPPPPPHPAYNISINGPYDQYVVEVTGSCSQ